MSRRKLIDLDTPFSAVQWPDISQDDQDTILTLLCNILAPLGQYRRNYIAPSRGKRRKKQKKKTADPEPAPDVPPAPGLAAFVDVGLANVTRVLEQISSAKNSSNSTEAQKASNESGGGPFYSAVFIARSGHPSAFNSHFPQMVAVASNAKPQTDAIRLVGFSKACEERLSACLGIPRVSTVALRAGAPHCQALVDFVRTHVPPVEVAWLGEAKDGKHRETKINVTEVASGPKKQRKS